MSQFHFGEGYLKTKKYYTFDSSETFVPIVSTTNSYALYNVNMHLAGLPVTVGL